MRSKSRSNRRLVFAAGALAFFASVTMGGCRLFVDLEGLGDEPPLGPGDGSTQPDGTIGPDGTTADGGGTDSTTTPDVIEEPFPDGGCPSGRGPVMARVTAGGTSFCIDTTETTREQYDTFLKSIPAGGAAECAWKSAAGYTPTVDWPYDNMTKNHPVVGVDWCDAKAFCAWSGKRLCGLVGGGAVNSAEVQLPAKSEWVFACTNGGTQAFPYGNVYNANTCNGADLAANRVLPVGSLAGCKGGFPALSDMSGNVHEWLNACDVASDASAPDQNCGVSGSAFTHGASDMPCTYIEGIGRGNRFNEIGIRCCSP